MYHFNSDTDDFDSVDWSNFYDTYNTLTFDDDFEDEYEFEG